MKEASALLVIKEVTAATWPDFERFFSAKGGPSYCWCMAWRSTGGDRAKLDNAARKQAMRDRVERNIPVGLLGYLQDEPVAWCSVAPSTTYRRLRKDVEPSEEVWSIVCFFIRRDYRGRGLAKAMLDAAVDHARKRGAKVVEAYPVDENSPSYRFMGFVPMFAEAGFQEVARAGARRHVMWRRGA